MEAAPTGRARVEAMPADDEERRFHETKAAAGHRAVVQGAARPRLTLLVAEACDIGVEGVGRLPSSIEGVLGLDIVGPLAVGRVQPIGRGHLLTVAAGPAVPTRVMP